MFFEIEIGMVTVERDIGVMVKRIISAEDDSSKVADEVRTGAGSTYHTTMILITNYHIVFINPIDVNATNT